MKAASARQRTISLFTGLTDVESPLARDGSIPRLDRDTMKGRLLHKWKATGSLKVYECPHIGASIEITREQHEVRERWLYIVTKAGQEIGTCFDMSAAADLAEGWKL